VTDGKRAAAIRFMLMAMTPDRAPRAENKSVARLPVVLPGASVVSVSRQRKRPASGRRPPASRSPKYVLFASEVLAGRMPERGKSGY
jgi:hypothetical protein